MSDEDGIRRTIAKYCQLFDSKKWDETGGDICRGFLGDVAPGHIPGQGERDR